MQITQCLHAAVLVSDLERAEHFYGKVLRLSKVERSLKYPGAWYQVGEFQIHLLIAPAATDTLRSSEEPYTRKSSPAKLQNPEKWGSNPHIALCVTDLEAAKNQLLAHSCPIQMSASGRAALFTQDPDGNIIELSQP